MRLQNLIFFGEDLINPLLYILTIVWVRTPKAGRKIVIFCAKKLKKQEICI